MARLCLLLLSQLLCALGARLERPEPAPAPWRAASSLSADAAWQVLGLVPHPYPPVVAWARRTWCSILGAERPELRLGDIVFVFAFSPSGDRLLAQTHDGYSVLTFWHLPAGHPLWILPGEFYDAQVFPSGDRVATLDTDGVVVVRDAASGGALRWLISRHGHGPRRILLLGEARLVTSGSRRWGGPMDEYPATIWDLASGNPRHQLWTPSGRGVDRLVASPCSSKLATVSSASLMGADLVVYVWDVEAGRLQRELRASKASTYVSVYDVAISQNGARVVAKGANTVLIWDGHTGELRRRISLPLSNMFALLPGGRRFVATNRSDAAVWDSETGERVIALEPAARPSMAREFDLAVSPCGRIAAVCAADSRVESILVWDTRSGRLLHRAERRVAVVSVCSVVLAPMTTMADELRGASP